MGYRGEVRWEWGQMGAGSGTRWEWDQKGTRDWGYTGAGARWEVWMGPDGAGGQMGVGDQIKVRQGTRQQTRWQMRGQTGP